MVPSGLPLRPRGSFAFDPVRIDCPLRLPDSWTETAAIGSEAKAERQTVTKARQILPVVVLTMAAVSASGGSAVAAETIPECGRVDGDGLFVFVGEKLEVMEVPPPPDPPDPGILIIRLDYQYRARYRVIDRICGEFKGDMIEFDAFDHWGYPAFARYETVLLYVSRHGDRYVHQKYQFNDVYRTRSGEWASCGDPYRREPEVHRGDIQAVPLEFEEPLLYSVAGFTEERIAERFPVEYFSREGDYVACRAGATADVLYTVKRLGVLKSREQLR